MGGLISLYAFFRRPSPFGARRGDEPVDLVRRHARSCASSQRSRRTTSGRLYLDVGTSEGAGTLRDTRTLNRLLRRKGYRKDTLWYLEAAGAPAPGSRLGLAAAAGAGISAPRSGNLPCHENRSPPIHRVLLGRARRVALRPGLRRAGPAASRAAARRRRRRPRRCRSSRTCAGTSASSRCAAAPSAGW